MVFLAVAVLAASAAERGAGAPSRIVDRTLVCTPIALYGGVRDLDVKASPRGDSHVSGVRSTSTGYIGVGSGRTSADFRRCARARVSVPFSAKGLPGPPTEFGTDAECQVRGRVLLRVRAVLEAPTPWRPSDPPYAGARRNVVEAKIAVRSETTRKPLAYIELDAAGETKLWSSSACG